ncbi:TPA: hypothetical protein U1269_001274 [Streptococcus suis]|nr:hypothetical protein [Streptococcus suis]
MLFHRSTAGYLYGTSFALETTEPPSLEAWHFLLPVALPKMEAIAYYQALQTI